MDLKDFRAGNFIQQAAGYKSFEANLIENSYTWTDAQVNTLLEEANFKLGELNSFSGLIPDIEIFIKMHIVKEGSCSSKIEGTQTSVEEALSEAVEIDPERKDDWKEVHNYISAMNFAIDRLNELPLSNRLLKEAHGVLLEGVRGSQKFPGEFRKSQNWIGGATLQDAVFIPPHWESVPNLMSDLEKFIHNQEVEVPHLIKLAILHYQLETIHPFCDGNGRIGRLLITLYFIQSQILRKPVLYLSDFLEKNKTLYYDNLMKARLNNDLTQWIKFFLVAVAETSKKGIDCFQKIIELKKEIDDSRIPTMGRKFILAKKFMNYLYSQPLVQPKEVSQVLETSLSTANTLIQDFVRLQILEEKTGFKRNRIFVFRKYLNLFVD